MLFVFFHFFVTGFFFHRTSSFPWRPHAVASHSQLRDPAATPSSRLCPASGLAEAPPSPRLPVPPPADREGYARARPRPSSPPGRATLAPSDGSTTAHGGGFEKDVCGGRSPAGRALSEPRLVTSLAQACSLSELG